MNCDSCKSERLLRISAKASDLWDWTYQGLDGGGYAPLLRNFCGGDYLDTTLCLECGKIQGDFPVPDVDMLNDD